MIRLEGDHDWRVAVPPPWLCPLSMAIANVLTQCPSAIESSASRRLVVSNHLSHMARSDRLAPRLCRADDNVIVGAASQVAAPNKMRVAAPRVADVVHDNTRIARREGQQAQDIEQWMDIIVHSINNDHVARRRRFTLRKFTDRDEGIAIDDFQPRAVA